MNGESASGKPESLRIGSVIEREKACHWCGTFVFKIEPGTQIHAAHLRCEGCGKGGLWIGKREAGRLGLMPLEAA